MTRTPLTTHWTEDCRWSVPSLRRTPTSDRDDAFETYWACERTRVPRAVTPEDCRACPHWAPERDDVEKEDRRRR